MSSIYCVRAFASFLAILSSVSALAECPAVPGADAVLWKPRIPVVWVGETHGTKETPAAFADLVCDALKHGKNVTVGLEFMSQSQAALDALVGPDDLDAAKKELLASPNWQMLFDGRSSEAMLALLMRLRDLKSSHPSLRVVAIELPWENIPGEKDVVVAKEVKTLIKPGKDNVVLLLTGNLHGMKQSPLPYKTAAMFLPPEQVFSLFVVAGGGTAWQATDKGCGSQPGGTQDKVKDRRFGVYSDSAYSKYGVDGVLALGMPITASPPANASAAAASACRKQFLAQTVSAPSE